MGTHRPAAAAAAAAAVDGNWARYLPTAIEPNDVSGADRGCGGCVRAVEQAAGGCGGGEATASEAVMWPPPFRHAELDVWGLWVQGPVANMFVLCAL
jgi:hypothetical protein